MKQTGLVLSRAACYPSRVYVVRGPVPPWRAAGPSSLEEPSAWLRVALHGRSCAPRAPEGSGDGAAPAGTVGAALAAATEQRTPPPPRGVRVR